MSIFRLFTSVAKVRFRLFAFVTRNVRFRLSTSVTTVHFYVCNKCPKHLNFSALLSLQMSCIQYSKSGHKYRYKSSMWTLKETLGPATKYLSDTLSQAPHIFQFFH